MAAELIIHRDNSFRTLRLAFRVEVDGADVGLLKRGEELTCDLSPGKHDVQAFFARASTGEFNPRKRSAKLQVDVIAGETATATVKLGSAAAASFGAVGGEEDWLLLWPGTGGEPAASRGRLSPNAISAILVFVALGSLVVSRTVARTGPVYVIATALIGLSFLAFLLLTYRRYSR